MTEGIAILEASTPSLSAERAARSFYAERIPLSPPLPDRDLRWRWGVAILAALLLHLGVVTTLDDGFLREKSPEQAPIPVDIVTEPPPPPKPVMKPPEQQKPPEPQQPLPYRSSNGDLPDKPSGSMPKADQSSEKPQPPAAAPAPPIPQPQASTPKPAPTPALPSEPATQAVPVPPPTPRATQQALIAPPLPPKKPPTPPTQQSISTVPPQDQTAAPSPSSAEDPHIGEGGFDKYLRDLKMRVLGYYYYPPTAEMFHQEGLVVYDIVLDRSGAVREVRVMRSAGSLLDRAGYNAIMRGSPYGPLPDYIKGEAVRLTLDFPMPVP